MAGDREGVYDGELGDPLPKDSWKALCPECGEQVPGALLVCPECGHDFRADTDIAVPVVPQGLAYTVWADIALLIGQVMSLIGCAVVVGLAVIGLLLGRWSALLWGPLLAFQSLAMYVVFARVHDRLR